MRKKYTVFRMRENGSWRSVQRNFTVPFLFKKRKIKKTIKSIGEFGKYKISKGKDKALFVIEYKYNSFSFRKGDNEITKKRKINNGSASIELSFRKDTERGYRKLQRWFGVTIVDEELKKTIEKTISEHEIDPGTYLYQVRRRYASGVFDSALLKFQRDVKVDGDVGSDTLQDISTGELIWKHANPTFATKFLEPFKSKKGEWEKKIAEAEKEQERRVAEEKAEEEEIREAAAEKEENEFKRELKKGGFNV